MKPRHLFYTAVLLFAGTHNGTLLAQEMPKVIPPSPEVGTILQHSPINVSLYTGTPNISVPFHTISHGGVEVPVSLSYSTDGIRVNSIASRTGMGWSLSSGGLVSRTINKLPDDVTEGYMNTSYTVLDLMSRDPDGTGTPSQQDYHISVSNGFGNYRDYEADTFNFSFLGYSGQFYYNQQEQAFNQAPLSRLKIDAVKESGTNKIKGFIIIDENGVKYYFGEPYMASRPSAREVLTDTKSKSVTYDGVVESSPTYPMGALNVYQSWMLMDIVFPTSQETIKFFYSTEYGVKTHTLIDQEYIKCDIGTSENNISYLVREFNQPSIDSIIFPTGKILFEKQATERLDLDNSYALKSISLFDKGERFVKKMVLHTSQVTSTDTQTYFYDSGQGRYRLMLNAVTEEDLLGNVSGRYSFEYNSPQTLPNRFSRAIDYFGYYNAKNNTSLIPFTYVPRLDAFFGDADRTIDPQHTQIGVLTKATYPAGGFDKFFWENNDIGRFGGNGISYQDHLEKDGTSLSSSDYTTNFANNKFTRIFTVPATVRGKAHFKVFQLTGCTGPDLNQIDCNFKIKVESTDTNSGFVALNIFQSEFYHDLPAGEYRITATPKGTWLPPTQTYTDPKQFQFFIDWAYDETPNELLYSGLRIQRIETYDKQDSPAFSKTYQYKSFVNGISSGSTPNIYDCLFNYYLYSKGSGFTTSQGVRGIKLSGVSIAPQISTKGSLVGYEYVTELFNDGLQGRKEYTYSYTDNYNSQLLLEPRNYYSNDLIQLDLRNYVYCDWLRGNLKLVETYSQYGKLSTVEHLYSSSDPKPIVDFGLQVYQFPSEIIDGAGNYEIPQGLSWYSAVTEYHRLTSTTETNFLGGNQVTVLKEYSYNPLSQLSQERTFDNNQLDTTTKYFYPSDDSMSAKPFALELKEQNRIGTPLVTTTSDAGGELSQQETVFKDWDPGVALHLAPELIKTGKGGGTLEPRVKYNTIDINTGNPLEVQQADGTKISYIWGYNKTQPVAKIENMAYASIPGNLITAIESASNYVPNVTYSEANLLTALTNLRTDAALANAMVTTYTYRPLVGISTITDPKGEKVTYHYDNFNRLQFVKDRDGNILSENQYHYRPQN